MKWFTSDNFEKVISGLHRPTGNIPGFHIKEIFSVIPSRNDESTLILNVKARLSRLPKKRSSQIGTSIQVDDSFVIHSKAGVEVTINKYFLLRSNYGGANTLDAELVFEVDSIEVSLPLKSTEFYTAALISNIPPQYDFPNDYNVIEEIADTIEIKTSGNSLNFHHRAASTDFLASGVIDFHIGDYIVHLLKFDEGGLEGHESKTGMILIEGDVSKKEIEKITICLSCVFGCHFPFLGYIQFTNDLQFCNYFQLYSPSTMRGVAYKVADYPPHPLCNVGTWKLNSENISKIANAFYFIYEKYQLRIIHYQYCESSCAPPIFRAAFFGACIEAIRANYSRMNSKIKWTIVDKNVFQKIKDRVSLVIDEEASNCSAELIENFSFVNNLSNSKFMRRFCGVLDMEYSNLEEDAWKQRNNAAHGKIPSGSEIREVARDNMILRTLFHRILLRVAFNENTQYIDYTSIDEPVRSTSKSCLGDAFNDV